jgi:hypothetical protein
VGKLIHRGGVLCYRLDMARMRTCGLCSATVKQNVAAHDCPHDLPCHYLTDEGGMPVDWSTPNCGQCRKSGTQLRVVPSFSLTDKALDELD